MTTFIVYSGHRMVSTTHDAVRAEKLAAAVRDGHVVTVEREPTAGELMRDERVAA